MKKGVLGNFTKFSVKTCARVSFFNKVAGTLAQVFSYEFCKISKNTSFTEHIWSTASDIVEMSELMRQ